MHRPEVQMTRVRYSRSCCGVEPHAGLDADDAPVGSLLRRSRPSSDRGVLSWRSTPARSSPPAAASLLCRTSGHAKMLPPVKALLRIVCNACCSLHEHMDCMLR